MKYIDIHTHVAFQEKDVINVQNVLPGEDLPESPFSIGLHPWFIEEKEIDIQLEAVGLSAEESNCVAIGECGLDRPNFKKNAQTIQEVVFREQIKIANLANRPMIIHCVRAFPELLHIHKTEKNTTPWIIHGFRGNEEEALSLTSKGIYLSFGKSISYDLQAENKIFKVFSSIPEEMIFLETDNVETPERDIKKVYQKAAEIRGISITEMTGIIENNFKKVFNSASFIEHPAGL